MQGSFLVIVFVGLNEHSSWLSVGFDFSLNFGGGGRLRRLCKPDRLGMATRLLTFKNMVNLGYS